MIVRVVNAWGVMSGRWSTKHWIQKFRRGTALALLLAVDSGRRRDNGTAH